MVQNENTAANAIAEHRRRAKFELLINCARIGFKP
jgi:hypothetical protein